MRSESRQFQFRISTWKRIKLQILFIISHILCERVREEKLIYEKHENRLFVIRKRLRENQPHSSHLRKVSR